MGRTATVFLIDDEIVEVGEFAFRVQIWRGHGKPPIALLIQLPGEPSPCLFATGLAQIVVQRFLRCSSPLPTILSYGISGTDDNAAVAHRIGYTVIGNEHRPIIGYPEPVAVSRSVMERMFRLEPASLDPRLHRGH